jgi:hypothetical protein
VERVLVECANRHAADVAFDGQKPTGGWRNLAGRHCSDTQRAPYSLSSLTKSRQVSRPETPWHDPYDVAAALLAEIEAIKAGRACRLLVPEPSEPLSKEAQAALDRIMGELDVMDARLTSGSGA